MVNIESNTFKIKTFWGCLLMNDKLHTIFSLLTFLYSLQDRKIISYNPDN